MATGDVEAVRNRIDIVELVSETVPLKKAGRQFSAPCPFHTEKTPSFYVDPARQTWRCFGACATGGDVFSFLMKRDHLEFGEALRALAERAGVTLSRGRAPEEQERHERLYAANEAAVLFFRNALQAGEPGRAARDYAGRRGLDAATLERFEIGFAPEGWDHLRGYLHGKGFADEELIEAGLLTQGERGVYDRFRGRLMFPIRDEKGRVVGFGGRALGDEKPKYLNTPQTAVFDKGSLLFLLDRAKERIRQADEAVLVEGYLDAITAHQFGYTNVVATLGTALTERHVALLKRYARRVTLAMDADAAGIQAAVRGEEVARTAAGDEGDAEVVVSWDALVRVQARAPVQVRVFTVPSGKDPDEAIREDPQGWPAWVAAAVPPFEFRLRYELARTDIADPRARVELADRMLPLLLQVSDRALQASYVALLAERAGVHPDRLAERLRGLVRRKDAARPLPARVPTAPLPEQPNTPAASTSAPPRGDSRIERTALALLLRFPTLRAAGEALEPEIFEQTALRELLERW
ncbi:MAG TPA: DNA primase, partial [Dehalococcoidia bacterium]|nr:DNA primase [Dehalococcoidia bacterium]